MPSRERCVHGTLVGLAFQCILMSGCLDNELGIEKRIANQPPETVLSSGPPDSTDGTSYKVSFFWSGSDADGFIEHYDFILVDHPAPRRSISGEDSATTVVVTMPEIDDPRWVATHQTDSTFVTLADILRRDPQPGDSESPEAVRQQFFERWHTFFVRAVDDQGIPDPTPDYRSFNAVNLAPTVELLAPIRASHDFTAPPVVVFNWDGQDPIGDGFSMQPVASRWVLIESQVDYAGNYTTWPESLYVLPQRSSWSPWRRWDAADGSGRQAIVRNLLRVGDRENPPSGHYLFAVQALDEAGAITAVFDTETPGKNNAVRIKVSGRVGPKLVVEERFLGTHVFVGGSHSPVRVDVVAGQEIAFAWRAEAFSYGGQISGYRYGWNIRNRDDDAEWSTWSLMALSAPASTFTLGTQRFYLQVLDTAGSITEAIFELTVHRVSLSRDLLWVDDGAEIILNSATEIAEDLRWTEVLHELALQHGFQFDPVRDVFDVYDNANQPPPIERVFDYKAVVWHVVGGGAGRRLTSALRSLALFDDPFDERAVTTGPFNYLNSYIENGGRLWLCGFRPAREVWPVEHRPRHRSTHPINVTNWGLEETHPLIDSVGVRSLLYKMGVEMFDTGAGVDAARHQLEHFCQRVAPAHAQGSGQQSFPSVRDERAAQPHTHLVALDADDPPPMSGYETSLATELEAGQQHRHTVRLDAEDRARLLGGVRVVLESSEALQPATHHHTFELFDQWGAWGTPVLEISQRWPQPEEQRGGLQGRPNIEIYNMAGQMLSEKPPLQPREGISIPVYTYASAFPVDSLHGKYYPLTADREPVFILSKASPDDADYSRAICGFEPFLLTRDSHKRLAEFVLVRHFRLGL